MSGHQHHEPDDSQYCEAVRIGRDGKNAEVTIFYTPDGGQGSSFSALIKRCYFEKIIDCVDPISLEFEVHNGYLAEKKSRTNFGRSFDQLKIITSRGKKIMVRRYDDEGGEFPFLVSWSYSRQDLLFTTQISYFVEFEILSDGYWLEQRDVELWEHGKLLRQHLQQFIVRNIGLEHPLPIARKPDLGDQKT